MFGSDIRNALLLGRALWNQAPEVEPHVFDVAASISLLGLQESEAAERAALLLLEDAKNGRAIPMVGLFNQPFFRLFPEERIILALLHFGKWSYARIARAIGEDPTKVEELAWSARITLSSSGDQGGVPAPRGSSGLSCPHFEPSRPWIQAYLDREPHGNALAFLQSHLQSCAACRASLQSAREIYYRAEKMIPLRDILESPQAVALEKSYQLTFAAAHPSAQNFVGSLELFFMRKDAKLLLGALVACILVMILK